MSETCLLEVVHGSRLYGTVHAESDLDLKSVWLPSARDVLLGETDWTINNTNGHRRNTKDDVDHERMDLLKFVRSLSEGHVPFIEVLLAPESAQRVAPHPVVRMLADNIELVVPNKPSLFLTYIEAQAPSFAVKSPRAEVAAAAANYLEGLGADLDRLQVADVAEGLLSSVISKFVSTGVSKTAPVGESHRLLFVCGKAFSFGASARSAAEGARRVAGPAAPARTSAKKDWKSVYHALRFAHEAVEFYTTGHIGFPRPDVPRLMDVRAGRVPDDEIADEMYSLLREVPRAAAGSGLRDAVDVDFLLECVASVYADKVRAEFFQNVALEPFVFATNRGL